MTERNQCGCADDGLGMDATSGATPPLLPTLFMALVLGGASLLCREPAAPAPAPMAAPLTVISTTMAPRIVAAPALLVAEAVTPFVPAALAFPRQFPLLAAAYAAPMPVVAQHRPAGPRVASLRRAVPAKAPAVAEAPRVDPAASVARVAAPVETDDVLPDLALPFAPAIQAVSNARDFIGVQGAAARTQASAFGGAVVEFVGTLR